MFAGLACLGDQNSLLAGIAKSPDTPLLPFALVIFFGLKLKVTWLLVRSFPVLGRLEGEEINDFRRSSN